MIPNALERDSDLYDGGIDWSGVIWRANEQNIISSLVEALNSFRIYSDKEASAGQKASALNRVRALGMPEGSEFLWPLYATYYYLATINIFRMAYDPTFLNRP
jgi:hypothetical protein